MSYDIYGNPLQRGHCEVHPHVHEEYPCSVCIQENNNRNAQQQSESEHYETMRLEHAPELSQQRIEELEQRNNELTAAVERLRGAIDYCTSYLAENRLNTIGSWSKAYKELQHALESTPQQNLNAVKRDVAEATIKTALYNFGEGSLSEQDILDFAAYCANKSYPSGEDGE